VRCVKRGGGVARRAKRGEDRGEVHFFRGESWFVRVDLCVYVCVCVCMCVHVSGCVCVTCMHAKIVYARATECVAHTYIYTYTHIHMHAYVHTYMHA